MNVQQNGQIPPSVFNTWYNEVSLQLFKTFYEHYQTNQVEADLLAPFEKRVNVLVSNVTGQNWGLAAYPSDYEYFIGMSILRQQEEETCFVNDTFPLIDGNGKSMKFSDPDFAAMKINFAGANVEERQLNLIDSQRWPSCLTHRTKGPTWTNPKATQFAGGFRVAPKGIAAVVLAYLSTPTPSVFNYTVSTQDILIYNPATSVQLQWSVQVLPYFLEELQKKYASYVGDPNLFQMANIEKQ